MFKNLATDTKANLLALFAVVLWGTQGPCFSFLTNKQIPAYQILMYVFTVSTLVATLYFKIKGDKVAAILNQPIKIWLLGIFGIFGFHLFYILAFQVNDGLETFLIVTMWPLLIVILAIPFFNERISLRNALGLCLAMLGVYLVLGKGDVPSFEYKNLLAYIFAFIAAVIWALYSIFCKKISNLPKQAIANFCFSTAVISALVHLSTETNVALGLQEILIIVYMGSCPLCVAFFAWDFGIRRGDVKLISTISYLGPIVGSLLFVVLGITEFTTMLFVATLMIVGGSFISGYKGKGERVSQPNMNVVPSDVPNEEQLKLFAKVKRKR